MSKKQKALEAEIANDNSQAQDNISQGVVAPLERPIKKKRPKTKKKTRKRKKTKKRKEVSASALKKLLPNLRK